MDIVLRATVAFAFVLFVTRVVGRRELSSLQPSSFKFPRLRPVLDGRAGDRRGEG